MPVPLNIEVAFDGESCDAGLGLCRQAATMNSPCYSGFGDEAQHGVKRCRLLVLSAADIPLSIRRHGEDDRLKRDAVRGKVAPL